MSATTLRIPSISTAQYRKLEDSLTDYLYQSDYFLNEPGETSPQKLERARRLAGGILFFLRCQATS